MPPFSAPPPLNRPPAAVAPPRTTLYRSDTLHVFGRLHFPGQLVVVTFSSYADEPGLDRQGFGEAFLYTHAINAVHVVCGSNHWFQYPDIPAALAAIRAALPAHAVVATYGLSMGGYAAINFSEALNARRVVAISPQYSVDPAKMPRERRWHAETRAIRFIHDQIDRLQGRVDKVFLVYDNRNTDWRHIHHIRRNVRVADIVIPFAGHPVSGFLTETGLLSGLALDLLRDQFDAVAFSARLRAAQQQSGTYLLGLHKALPPHRRGLRRALLVRAGTVLRHRIGRKPHDKDAWFHLFQTEDALGRTEDAIAALRHYLSHRDYLWGRLHLARLLLRQARPENTTEAATLLDSVLSHVPGHWEARMLRAVAWDRLHRWPPAIELLQSMVRERPASLAAHLMLRHLRKQQRTGRSAPLRSLPYALTPRFRKLIVGLVLDAAGRRRDAITAARIAAGSDIRPAPEPV